MAGIFPTHSSLFLSVIGVTDDTTAVELIMPTNTTEDVPFGQTIAQAEAAPDLAREASAGDRSVAGGSSFDPFALPYAPDDDNDEAEGDACSDSFMPAPGSAANSSSSSSNPISASASSATGAISAATSSSSSSSSPDLSAGIDPFASNLHLRGRRSRASQERQGLADSCSSDGSDSDSSVVSVAWVKRFPCSFTGCTKRFRSKSDRVAHMRTHTRDKPLICRVEGCNKGFAHGSNRCQHERTHTQEKRYRCRYPSCSKRYAHPTTRNNHEAVIHRKEMPYDCPHCEEKFRSPRTRNSHVSKCHR